ncbi:MAG: thioredoxin family protein [Saprospiraceae bacterium]
MKYLQTFILLLFISSIAISQGISFESSTFDKALEKAKSEDKLVFIDAYTTWCGPCKWMSKNVFTDSDIGTYFNEKFVNMKIDMEKGEGKSISDRYDVVSYPTLLFVDGDGKIIHRSIGSRPVADFLDLGKAANDPERQISTLTARYTKGEKSSEFLKIYTAALTSAGNKIFAEIAEEYMNTQKDWTNEDNMMFIYEYSDASLDSKLFQYMLKHKDSFIAKIGKDSFEEKVDWAADKDRSKIGIARDDISGLKKHFVKYYDGEKANNKAMVTYFRQAMYAKDKVGQEKFKSEIQLFLAALPDVGSRFYNSVAWQVYEITDDNDLLKKAAIWTEKSIAEENNSYNNDTLAAILFKLGNIKDAKKYALKSIELAKEEGNDYSATDTLLEKINTKLKG